MHAVCFSQDKTCATICCYTCIKHVLHALHLLLHMYVGNCQIIILKTTFIISDGYQICVAADVTHVVTAELKMHYINLITRDKHCFCLMKHACYLWIPGKGNINLLLDKQGTMLMTLLVCLSFD